MASQLTTHTTLLARLGRDGDDAAWHEFEARYGALIRGYARRHGLQSADCDDVLQDVLLGLGRAMPDFDYDPARGRFRSFLKTITNRAVFKKFRQKPPGGRQQALDAIDPLAEDGQERAWEREWQAYHLRLAMQRIASEFGTHDRAAFEAYVVQGRDAAETAAALNLSLDQVYQAKSRILKRLGEIVARQVEEEG